MVEVLWKATTGIINWRLTAAVMYHGRFHGFQMGQGKGTAILEAKLLHKTTSMREAVLHTVLLDLQKVYNALDWDWCLKIMEEYGVTSDDLDLAGVLDSVVDGYEVWMLIQPPFPGIPWGNTGKSLVIHSLQRGGGRHDPALGGGSDADRGGSGGNRINYPGVGDVFLQGLQVGSIDPAGEVVKAVQCPHRPLQPGRSPYKRAEDGDHGMRELFHPWRVVGVGVHAASDGDQSLLLIDTVAEGGVTGVRSGNGGRVYANKYSGKAHSWLGVSGATSHPLHQSRGRLKTI